MPALLGIAILSRHVEHIPWSIEWFGQRNINLYVFDGLDDTWNICIKSVIGTTQGFLKGWHNTLK